MPPLPAPAEGTAGYPPRGGRGTLPGWRPPDRNALRGAGPQPEGHAVITRPGLRGVRSAGAPAPHLPDRPPRRSPPAGRSEEHTSELQSRENLVCRLLLEKKNKRTS